MRILTATRLLGRVVAQITTDRGKEILLRRAETRSISALMQVAGSAPHLRMFLPARGTEGANVYLVDDMMGKLVAGEILYEAPCAGIIGADDCP